MSPTEAISNPLWRWNPDLRSSPQERAGERVVVLQDPTTGEHFQLGESEYQIARSFGVGCEEAEVRARLAEGGQPLDAGELHEFVLQLVEARILVPASSAVLAGGAAAPASPGNERPDAGGGAAPGREIAPVPAAASRARWRRSGLLQLELAVLRPEAFFVRTLRWVRPLLGAPFLIFGTFLCLAALAIAGANLADLRLAVAGQLRGATLLLGWVVLGGVVMLHELAHGWVCTHFGGRVQALGFLLLYGRPCAFCDVSSAWLFGRRARLWVMAAGSLFELGAWAASLLIWRLTAPETLLNRGALLVATVCGVGTLFNLNPLLKFDGYYMLSDALEIPNLRQRAFTDLWARLRRVESPPGSRRERRVFVVYGPLALLYSILVLGWLALQVRGWMQARWGGPGLVLFWGAVSVISVRPLAGRIAGLRTALAVRWHRRAVLLLAAGGIAALLLLVHWPLKVASECQLGPRARSVVRSDVAGSIEAVEVVEGQEVQAGAVLLRLATRDLDYALASARSEVEELRAKLALLVSGARQQEIDMTQRRAEAAATRVQFERKAYERARASLQSDLVSRQSVEDAERELRLAEDEQKAADKALELLQAGARPEEIQAMRARLEVVSTEAARLQDDRSRTAIVAPISGRVLSPHADRLVGRFVARGDSLLVLADLRRMVLEIPVSEKEVADVRLGAPVRFKARSLPARTFTGSVIEIAPAAAAGDRQRTVLVRSELDNADGVLRPETSGYAKIYCGKRPLGALLLRRAVRMLRTEFWALW